MLVRWISCTARTSCVFCAKASEDRDRFLIVVSRSSTSFLLAGNSQRLPRETKHQDYESWLVRCGVSDGTEVGSGGSLGR